jgi:putative endonuclease
MRNQFYVYILASPSRVLYVGVTNNLYVRLWQHRNEGGSSFVRKYRVTRLVHYEIAGDPVVAITREKEIQAWRRSKKVALIEASNPDWNDLAVDWGL